MWKDLTMKEKAAFMKVAINNGITDLLTIRDKYNSFALGGPLDSLSTKYPEVTIKEEPWADNYFRNNTKVAGMAIGNGINGVGGPRRVIINPYSNINKESVLLNERLRHYFDESNFKLPNPHSNQMDAYKGTPYEGDTLNIGRTEAARYLSGDPSHHLSKEQILFLNNKFNKKAKGGPLKDEYEGGTLPAVDVVKYSAKDKYGNPVRDTNNNLILGDSQKEAQQNFTDALLYNSDLRYKYMTPSEGIGSADLETLNTVTGGVLNWAAPSQLIGFGEELLNSNKKVGDAFTHLITGNSGVVSDNFANAFPKTSFGINVISDMISPSSFNPKKYFFHKTPNSFTRGIGNEKGLKDLIESGKIRGSNGTDVSPHDYNKSLRVHKEWDELNKKYPGISNRWYRRELSEDEFNIIKNTFDPPKEIEYKGFDFSKNSPLDKYDDYEDYLYYQNKRGVGVTYDENWIKDPMAYFYKDGDNPIISGHGYAKSNYGVKIDNASKYNPYIHPMHLHYTTKGPVYLADPNVSVYQRGPFNTTLKLNKNSMKPELYDFNPISDYWIRGIYPNLNNKNKK